MEAVAVKVESPAEKRKKATVVEKKKDPERMLFNEIGDYSLFYLLKTQRDDLFLEDLELNLPNETRIIKRPSILLCSLIKKLLEALWVLHYKKEEPFQGNIGDSRNIGLMGLRGKNGKLTKVTRVFLLQEEGVFRDLGKANLKCDRKRVADLISSLLEIEPKKLPPSSYLEFSFVGFKVALREFVDHPSESSLMKLMYPRKNFGGRTLEVRS